MKRLFFGAAALFVAFMSNAQVLDPSAIKVEEPEFEQEAILVIN